MSNRELATRQGDLFSFGDFKILRGAGEIVLRYDGHASGCDKIDDETRLDAAQSTFMDWEEICSALGLVEIEPQGRTFLDQRWYQRQNQDAPRELKVNPARRLKAQRQERQVGTL